MDTQEYDELMPNFNTKMKFDEVYEKWFKCFSYILKKFRHGFTDRTIKALFEKFYMENWKDLHKENTEFKNYSKEELFDHFCGECEYIWGKESYDRLFRTHWLFLNIFDDEINQY